MPEFSARLFPAEHRSRLTTGIAMAAIATTLAFTTPAPAHAAATVTAPPVNAGFDYQINGAYTPPAGVSVVSRDNSASPAAGLYNICYINAFQAQPNHDGDWASGLLLTDSTGATVVDKEWNESLLDISTPDKRTAIMQTIGALIDTCAAKGFNAVEPDNYDSYQRSNDSATGQALLTSQEAEAFMALLVQRAHADGLAIAQKNTLELASDAAGLGIDFAITEQCGANTDGAGSPECADFQAAFQNHVIDIEYDDAGLQAACSSWSNSFSIVERDLYVDTPSQSDYVRKTCADVGSGS